MNSLSLYINSPFFLFQSLIPFFLSFFTPNLTQISFKPTPYFFYLHISPQHFLLLLVLVSYLTTILLYWTSFRFFSTNRTSEDLNLGPFVLRYVSIKQRISLLVFFYYFSFFFIFCHYVYYFSIQVKIVCILKIEYYQLTD